MVHGPTYHPQTGFTRWLDQRLPIIRMAKEGMMGFPTPKNLSYLWTFGGILTFCLGVQIVTGIIMSMHYVADTKEAFNAVEHTMRDTPYGWLFRYTHMVGATMFLGAVFIHLFRGLYYGSYKAPREIIWMIGVVILILMMGTAFLGYALVWGQMSGWGVTVITSLVSALDSIYSGLGTTIKEWVWGGFSVDQPTLNRLFSLHYLLPFVIAAFVGLHVWALHVPGNNNPTGVEVRNHDKETLPFHPYYTVKDLLAVVVFMLLFAYIVFYIPNYVGDPANYTPYDQLKTPAEIKPEWYFLPFYAILRSVGDLKLFGWTIIDGKLGGVLAMGGALVVLFFIPWLDTSRVRSTRYRPIYKWFFWVLVFTCFALGYLGTRKPDDGYVLLGGWVEVTNKGVGKLFTIYYFAHFLLVMPILGLIETPKPLPASIEDSIKRKSDHIAHNVQPAE